MATTISLSEDTYKRLKTIAHKGQTFDGIIAELLDEHDKQSLVKSIQSDKETR